MEHNINLSQKAANVIEALRHNNGTLNLYRNTLTRIFNQILHTAEDMGMDELEALETLRVLDMLRRDITAIATEPRSEPVKAVAQFYEPEGDEDLLTELEDDELEGLANQIDPATFDHKQTNSNLPR